jgi:hypothetical protein
LAPPPERPDVVAARVAADLELTAEVGDHERSLGGAGRQVAELDVRVLAGRQVQAIERLPVDLGERGLHVGVRKAGALGRQRERELRHAEVAWRIARADRPASTSGPASG